MGWCDALLVVNMVVDDGIHLFTQGFTVQKNAKRLIVQMRPDAVSTMAYESNPAVSQVLTVSATDGTSVLALAPDADMSAVRAQLENDPGRL